MPNPDLLRYAFEGPDNSGKSTTTKELEKQLGLMGFAALRISSPSRNPLGMLIRNNLGMLTDERKERLFLYDLRRSDRNIPDGTQVVLYDRHIDSIYSSNLTSTKVGVDALAEQMHVPRPNRVFLLDITPQLAWARTTGGHDHHLDLNWLKMKHKRYLELLRDEPQRITRVDATLASGQIIQSLLRIIVDDLGTQNLRAVRSENIFVAQ